MNKINDLYEACHEDRRILCLASEKLFTYLLSPQGSKWLCWHKSCLLSPCSPEHGGFPIERTATDLQIKHKYSVSQGAVKRWHGQRKGLCGFYPLTHSGQKGPWKSKTGTEANILETQRGNKIQDYMFNGK